MTRDDSLPTPAEILDVDDVSRCPLGEQCANCGTTTDLELVTAGSMVGVHCLTLCGDCIDDGNFPRTGAPAQLVDLVLVHCTHLGITADEMAAAVEQDERNVR